MSEAAVQPQSAAPINALVAMIRVEDVERSAKFYELLGFQKFELHDPDGYIVMIGQSYERSP